MKPSVEANKCDLCDKKFQRNQDLKSHKTKLHSTKKAGSKTKCNFCEFSKEVSDASYDIQEHEKEVHLQKLVEKWRNCYSCENCQMYFKSRINRNIHVKQCPQKNSGLVTKCEHCSFKANNKNNLEKHINTL